MSVIVPSLTNNPHHSSSFFSTNTTRRINGNISQTKQQNRLTTNKSNENEQESDQVPYGVVNSMKQRLLNKVNQTFLLNNNSSIIRHTLSKSSSRISSNENIPQTKPSLSPLKRATRLSRSQDNLSNNNSISSISGQTILSEQINSYIQPKQDVIIVDTTTNYDNDDQGKLHPAQKSLLHRQSYTELHVDEAPKPGTVTTVKNMFERQIRLSRYDADKLLNTSSTPVGSRMNSQPREISSPTRSRSISPNDMAVRQRRATIIGPILPTTSTTLSLPVPTSYPDLVISHTPPTEPPKTSNEQILTENLPINNNKDKKLLISNRNSIQHEQTPLSVIVDESPLNVLTHHRLNLLLPSTSTSTETIDCQPLDFKSRLALFNRTNTERSNENSTNNKKSFNQINSSLLNNPTKPVIHHSTRLINEDKLDTSSETAHNQLTIAVSRSVVNTAKAVTFFGGEKLNENTKSTLPKSIPPPPPPPPISQTNSNTEQSSISTSNDILNVPDIIGGNVKLNKSSIFSGAKKKDIRVQFIDNVDTYEYPSFEIVMAELGSTGSDSDNHMDDDVDDDQSSTDSNLDNNNKINLNTRNGMLNNKPEEFHEKNIRLNHSDYNELKGLAHTNAKFNTNNLTEKQLKPKGTLHTFRPTHIDQYELGTQHGSQIISKSSDILSSTNSYALLARQKLLQSTEITTKNLSNHSIIIKQQKTNLDLGNNVQWSSMSTTTDLLF